VVVEVRVIYQAERRDGRVDLVVVHCLLMLVPVGQEVLAQPGKGLQVAVVHQVEDFTEQAVEVEPEE